MQDELLEALIDIQWNRLKLYPKRKQELSFYKAQMKVLQDKFLELGLPQAISYDKISFSSGGSKESLYNLVLSEQQEMQKKIDETEAEISFLEDLERSFSDQVKSFCEYKFFQGHTWSECEGKFFYSKRYMEVHIRSEIKQHLLRYMHI